MKAQADTQQIWAEMTARFSDRRLRECWETFKTDRPKFAAFVDLFTRLEMLDCHDEKRNSDKALLLKEIRGKVEALRKAHQNVIDREESYGLLKLEYEGRLQDFFPPEEKSAYAGLRKALVSIEYLRKLIETDELTEREDLLQTAIDINEAFVRLDNFLQTRVPVRRVEENEQGLLIEDEGGSNAEGGVEVVSAMTTDDLLVDILAPLINNEFRMFITSHSILASLNELVESKIWKMLDDPAAPPIAAKTRQNLWRIIRAISQIRKEQLAQCRLEYINPAEISLEEAQFIFRHRLETVSSDIDEAKSAGTDVQRLEGLLKGYQQQAADLDGRMDMSQAEKIKSLLELAGYVLKVTESSASTYGDKKSVSESGSQQDATGAVKVIDIFELNDINYLNIESIRDIMTELRALPESPERSDRLRAAQFMLSCVGVLNDEAIKPSHKRKLLIEILQFQHDLSISLPINMSGCNFGGEELCFITRSNMNMSGVNFNRATIRDCDFESSRFPGALLSGSIITASRFANECEFVKCPFIEAQFIGVYFNHSTFEEVDFSSASLVDVHFDDATLEDVCFVNVDLSSVTFNNATFSRVQFIPFVNKFTEAAWLELFSEWSRLGIPAETRFYNIYRNLKECNEYTAEEAVRVLTLHQEYKFEKLPSQIMHATLYQPRSEGKADTPIPSQISPRGDK